MQTLIQSLAEAWGPPGFEHTIRDLIRAEVEGVADEIRVDPLGNLICRVGDGPKCIMTAAHMDEIGLIVGHIDRQGFARFAPMGALFPAALLGARVRFANGVIGTIGVENQHSKRREVPATTGFYIDISQDATGNADVKPGDPAAFVADVVWRGSRVIGKSLDNRVGCAIQVDVMRRVKEQGTPHSLYFVFTAQEEVGTRGAAPAAYGIEPDFAIAIDAAGAGDVPQGRETAITLGGGVAIKARDAGLIVPAPVRDLMIQRAEAAGIPYQIEVIEGAATDGKVIQNVRAGVSTGGIAFPLRYVHTTSETADMRDITATADLLTALLTGEIPF